MSDFGDTDLSRDEERRVAVAEYVLGLGSVTSRATIARAIETDAAIASEARFWERNLSRFNDDYEAVAAPAGVFERIEQRLFGNAQVTRASWYDSLNFWRGLTGLAAAAAVVAVGLNLLPPVAPTSTDTTQLVAALQTVEGDVSFLARYDAASGQLRLTGSGSPAGTANDYELWFIEGDNAPISMGVLTVGEAQTVSVDDALREQFSQGITLAVTREIAGGSPTGAPEGPIVAAGPVAAI